MQPSGNTENQKVKPSGTGDFKSLLSNDRTENSKQPFVLQSSTNHFSSSHEQVLPTKTLGNTNAIGQPVQFKDQLKAQYSSKTDGDNERRVAAFTWLGFHVQGQIQQCRRHGEQFSITTENQMVSFVDKFMGSTDGTSHAKQYQTHGSLTQFSSNAVEHVLQTDFTTSSIGGLPAEKQHAQSGGKFTRTS